MAGERRGTVQRTFAVGLVAAALLSTMLITPGAQAAPVGGQSTSCSFVAKLKFSDLQAKMSAVLKRSAIGMGLELFQGFITGKRRASGESDEKCPDG